MQKAFLGKTALLSFAHAAVDFACAALFFSTLSGANLWTGMVLYNACAFLCQLPMGVLADRLNRNLPFAALGCVLVAAGFALRGLPILAVIVAGLGNGAFHVGGGIEVLNGSEDKAGPLGVFVSPGAIGLFLGRFYADFFGRCPLIPVVLLLLLAAAMLLIGRRTFRSGSGNAELSLELPKGGLPALILLFLVVVLRSFMGTTKAFATGDFLAGMDAWQAGLVPVLCLALGKGAGGFLADRFRPIPTAAVSLGLCAVLLCFPLHPAFALAALFLFNMTMPITLHESAKLWKYAKGTAFGLLTFALFVGIIPHMLGAMPADSRWLYGALALVSLLLLLPALRKSPCRTR